MPITTRKVRNFAATYRAPVFLGAPARIGGTVYVCGPTPTIAELEQLAQLGWTVHADGRYPTLRDPESGTVCRWAASWFGDGVSVAEAEALWVDLTTFLRRRFGDGARPIGTPATTGRDLWLRTIASGVAYPTLPAELQDVIRSTTGQGRIELARRRADTVPAVVEYDMRLAYAALLRSLPFGEPERFSAGPGRLHVPDLYRPARYYARWTAPSGWDTVGILPAVRTTDAGPTWPLIGEGWVDGAELHLAHRFGWTYEIREAIVWPNTCDPFRVWVERLVSTADTHGPRWRTAIRGLLLHSIGAMFGAPRTVTVFGDEAPAGAEGVQLLPSGRLRWVEHEPALWPETHHPEWTAAVWARARCRLLDCPAPGGLRVGALHVPAEHVIGLRTDAVYLTHDPRWPDDGAIGRLVHKRTGPAGSWPRSHTELLARRLPA